MGVGLEVGVGVAVAVAMAVAVAVAVGVEVEVGVNVAIGVAVAVAVGVTVGVAVGVAVAVGVGVPQRVSVYCWLSFVPVPGPELPATAPTIIKMLVLIVVLLCLVSFLARVLNGAIIHCQLLTTIATVPGGFRYGPGSS